MAIDGGDDRADDLLTDGLRKILVNAGEARGIEAIAHGDGQAEVEAFAGLHGQDFGGGFCVGWRAAVV